MEVALVVLVVIGVVCALVKAVRDPEPPEPATLEGGRSHMRGDVEAPKGGRGMGWKN